LIAASLNRSGEAEIRQLGGEPNHWSVIGRASVESDFLSVMDPSIAIVGCIAGVALVWKCLTF
jgi:hypothetical protein